MKTSRILGLIGISVLTMSSSCEKENEASPTPLTTGRLVKIETTRDIQNIQNQNSRPRWIVDVAPLSLVDNWPGHSYSQVKVFNLPNPLEYQAGQVITFHYHIVPPVEQTPWKTIYEALSMPPGPPGAVPLAEFTLSDVQLVLSQRNWLPLSSGSAGRV